MSDFRINVRWTRTTPDFAPKTYDRTHTVTTGRGLSFQASAAPQYFGRADLTNPEELLLAAVASCHMLTFLAVAAGSKLVVDGYVDDGVAVLGKSEQGKMRVAKVTLRPRVTFGGTQPDASELKRLHDKAHANCFVANSLAIPVEVHLGGEQS